MDTLTVDENANEGDDMQTERLPLKEYRLVVTKEIAQEFLERNTNNRTPRPAQINKISKALLLGEWMYNGEAIKFDWNGVLLDGQNRLHAIVATGVPAQVLIVEGLPPETQETMDGIVPRNLKDILVWRKEKDASSLAAVLNFVHIWLHNGVRSPSMYRPTHGQALTLLAEHPEIREATRHGQAIARKIAIPSTMAAACWYRFDKLDPEDNKDFWHAVTTGYHLLTDEEREEGKEFGRAAEPRKGPKLLSNYLHNEKGRRETPQWVKLANTIKAWNYYRDGEERHHLAFKAGGKLQEQFPEPH